MQHLHGAVLPCPFSTHAALGVAALSAEGVRARLSIVGDCSAMHIELLNARVAEPAAGSTTAQGAVICHLQPPGTPNPVAAVSLSQLEQIFGDAVPQPPPPPRKQGWKVVWVDTKALIGGDIQGADDSARALQAVHALHAHSAAALAKRWPHVATAGGGPTSESPATVGGSPAPAQPAQQAAPALTEPEGLSSAAALLAAPEAMEE